jgi:hypothetical protein
MTENENMSSKLFTGPLFLIGMPRSGTKLLRNLLTQHPKIVIPPVETEFLPYWVNKWESFDNLSNPDIFHNFYINAVKLPYFIHMQNRGSIISESAWYESCRAYTPGSVFEALIRNDTGIGFSSDHIWGDKSPSYITHIPQLKTLFPDAKFIHIVRDVRDYCLSIHNAWGKNMTRAAQRWNDNVCKAKYDAIMLDSDYHEIKYEHLIEDIDICLKSICDFLGIDFRNEMLELCEPSENLGDAKNIKGIVRNNKEKYLSRMHPGKQQIIERIALPALKVCNYPTTQTTPYRVPAYKMKFFQLLDGINLVRSNTNNMGFIGALKFYIRYFQIS